MKYNDTIIKKICESIEVGHTQKDAAYLAGLSERQFYDWKKNVLLACEGRREGFYGRPVASVVCIKTKTPVENKPKHQLKKVCPMCNGTGYV